MSTNQRVSKKATEIIKAFRSMMWEEGWEDVGLGQPEEGKMEEGASWSSSTYSSALLEDWR